MGFTPRTQATKVGPARFKGKSLWQIAKMLGDPLCTCAHPYSDHEPGKGCLWGDQRERCMCRMFDEWVEDPRCG